MKIIHYICTQIYFRKTMLKKLSILVSVMMFVVTASYAQQQYKMGLVGFYNLENLYDTVRAQCFRFFLGVKQSHDTLSPFGKGKRR